MTSHQLELGKNLDHDMEQGYCFEVTVHQILAKLYGFENFCKLFASDLILKHGSNVQHIANMCRTHISVMLSGQNQT